MAVVFSLLARAVAIRSLVDIITRGQSLVRFVPKVVWILLVVFVPLIGIIFWFAMGREYAAVSARRSGPRTESG